MEPSQASELAEHTGSSFRLDAQLHDMLMQPGPRPPLPARGQPQNLPEPLFPQHPELLGPVDPRPERRAVPFRCHPSLSGHPGMTARP
jgi:hypothetical protein